MAPSGIAMLMKSFGIDPNEITKQVQEFSALVASFNEKLDRIESKVDDLTVKLNEEK
jgi:hypothetical protein